MDGYDVAISHSLATSVLWSVLLGLVYLWWRRDSRGSAVVAAVVFSHWVLDLVSHRPELPVAPRIHRYLGLGLWNSIPMTFVVEGALWVLGVAIYLGATRSTDRRGSLGLVALIAVPTMAWLRTPFTSLPAGDFTAAVLIALLVIHAGLCLLGYWIDGHRPICTEPATQSVTRSH